MSKSQTLADLKKTGVKLTQAEAQEIHTRIGDISKGLHESGELFEVVEPKEMKQANNVQPSTGFTPLSEDNDSEKAFNVLNDAFKHEKVYEKPKNKEDVKDEALQITSNALDSALDNSKKPEIATGLVKAKAPVKPKAEKAVKAKPVKAEKPKDQ